MKHYLHSSILSALARCSISSRSQRLGFSLFFALLAGVADLSFAATINVPADQSTIQAAVNAAAPGDIILVAPGTYNENVTINKSLTLRSSGGRGSTFINGSAISLGTILISSNTNNVTIGGYDQGFTIKGFDSSSPGLETAAVYIQGVQSNITIRGNEIIADGEAALLSEYGANVSTLNINANIISGKTFVGSEPGGCGFSSQFTTPNVPRQLVYIGQATNITFTSNTITGTAGGPSTDPSCSATGQGNTLVTIFGNTGSGAVIRGNVFAGTTTRFGSQLRVRGTNASIIYNTFETAGLGIASFHIDLSFGTPLAGATPSTIEGVASLNTFTEGAYYTGSLSIYKNSAQVSNLSQTPISVNTIPLATVTNVNTGEKYGTIQSAIVDAATTNGHTILVGAGTYNEDVTINKSLTLQGAGCEVTSIVGPIGGDGATVRVSAIGVIVDGFTITREGNTVADWNNSNLNSAGVAIQGQTANAEIRNNKIVGNRTGIDINNSNSNNVHNNVITNNHTGLIFRNQTDNTVLMENEITENRTVGILFLDASGGSNSPVQTAANSSFNNNSISGNWYAEIVDRQAGGSLPVPGTNVKNFECNWYGAATPVITTSNSAEPGYASLIPVVFGGTATAPGGQPDIAGPGSANFDYIPLLTSGTDTDGVTKGFQPAGGTCVDCSIAPPTVTISGNTAVIFGFGSNCTTLTANPTGTGPFTYVWKMGNTEIGTSASQQVCPEINTTYSVTVTDAKGCSVTSEVTVNVKDVRCGNKNQNVTICYYGVTQCVSEKIAQRYLKLGATIGGCGSGNARIGVEETAVDSPFALSVKGYPNPTQGSLTVEVMSRISGPAQMQVLDLTGRAVQQRTEQLLEGLNEVKFDISAQPTGTYLIRAIDGNNRQGVVRVNKQ